MARFKALKELADASLTLPVPDRGGKVREYTIPSPAAETGLRVQAIAGTAIGLMAGGEDVDTSVLNDDDELSLYRLCLGDVHDQLIADGVDWAWHRHVAITAVRWILDGLDSAHEYWQAAGDPTKVAGPNRAARRASAKKAAKKSSKSGSAAGSKTRTRVSSSGTSDHPATSTAAADTAPEASSTP